MTTEFEVWWYYSAGKMLYAVTRIETTKPDPDTTRRTYREVAITTSEEAARAAQRLMYGLPQNENSEGRTGEAIEADRGSP